MNIIYWIILGIFILMLAIFLPRIIRNWREASHREQMEDALKFLLDREQEGRHASAESLAGSLSLSQPRTLKLLARMETQNLIEMRGHELHLTTEGERWALHIVRAHRLWERYLADEARMPLEKVHAEAHRREHNQTAEALDALEAALGHPTTDPHGDPIPSRNGKLAQDGGTELTGWQEDLPGVIVHIEDEPEIAYAQILAAGLQLGQTVRIIEKTSERYVLSDSENEYRLAPAVASNVHVAPLPDEERLPIEAIPLFELKHNQRGEIITLDKAVQGFTRRRFLDLGLTPGTMIYPELQNSFGDPRGYRIRGTLIALRKEQAAQIWVKPMM